MKQAGWPKFCHLQTNLSYSWRNSYLVRTSHWFMDIFKVYGNVMLNLLNCQHIPM